MQPTKYIDRMIENYYRITGEKPKEVTSPLVKGDHPELDTSKLLDEGGIKLYQSFIGTLQWVVTLGRLDIFSAVMTMSSFRSAPREGHLTRVKRIYGYLKKMRHGSTTFRVTQPDYSSIPTDQHDWMKSIYGKVEESIPHNAPEVKGPTVIHTVYKDANLCHDMVTGRSVTGIIHLLNKTVVDYTSKKQPRVETSTYGSEFMAARLATEQIIDMRLTLRYLGVDIKGPTYMFGDNKSVVDSSSFPRSKLHKRHNLLSYHRVREAIVGGIMYFIHIPTELNPADILTKLWGYQQARIKLKALLFWHGDIIDIE